MEYSGSAIRLSIQRHVPTETSADLTDIVQAIDGLIVPCVLAEIEAGQATGSEFLLAALRESARSTLAPFTFYPAFGSEDIRLERWTGFGDRGRDPDDPLDLGLQVGLNAWLRQTVRDADPALYSELFGFADVRRINHDSPLALTLVIVTVSAAGVAVAKLLQHVYKVRQERAKARMAEADAKGYEDHVDSEREQGFRQEEARTRQEEAKAELLEGLARALEERGVEGAGEKAEAITAATGSSVRQLERAEFSEFEVSQLDQPDDDRA